MNRLAKLLLAASIAILVTGIGLAVAQPGSLGDDDTSEAAPSGETTTTQLALPAPSTAAPPTTQLALPTPTTAAPTATPTTPTTPTTDGSTATTAPSVGSGSGVGSDGAGSGADDSDDLADTGGESLIVLGLALCACGLLLRRDQHDTARLR